MDLSGASGPADSRVHHGPWREWAALQEEANQPFDTGRRRRKELQVRRRLGRKAKITEEEYRQMFATTDQEYANMLQTPHRSVEEALVTGALR
jgi:hypothetical protein